VDYIAAYLREMGARGRAKRTLKSVKNSLRLFSEVATPQKRIRRPEVISFLESLKDRKAGWKVLGDVKAFYRWMNKGKLPDALNIQVTKKVTKKLPEELLTEAEVIRIMEATRDTKHAAFVGTLYESGARIGELGGIRLKHISFDKYGAVLMLDGKTGQRRVRVIRFASDLRDWLAHHPMKNEPDAFAFFGKNPHVPYSERAYADFLQRAASRAGVKKHIYPHLFRHSRATHLAKIMTEAELKVFFGWTSGSAMAGRYVHLSGADVDKKLLENAGMIEASPKKLAGPRLCPFCNKTQPMVAHICSECGKPMDGIGAEEMAKKEHEKSREQEKRLARLEELVKQISVRDEMRGKGR
jgi:integrase